MTKYKLLVLSVMLVAAITVVFMKGSFAISDPQYPDLTSIEPGNGPQSGGTEVTLFGNLLNNPTEINFGEKPATIINWSDSEVVVTVPANAPGVVDVYFKNALGSDVLTAAYIYEEESTDVGSCKKKKKELVCHLPNGDEEKYINLCLPPSAVSPHLDHGDYLGRCK